MALKEIHPEGWAPALGYANGMLSDDGTLHIGGQIGWNSQKVFESHDFIGQMTQILSNIRTIVEAAGGTPSDIGRLTWFVKSKAEYMAHQKEIGAAYRSVMGRHFPAMSLVVVADLLEDEALLEIEATAHVRPA
ncbi:RidA family protein [Shimia sp. R10_1]|uniref:RidA family protein n=1 Tax=Shimia sp. R10_1 TaxID=2821095 RepID=UPI001ADBABF4|nr:RidA family protein [Shimia sp. R10_1]MBO9472585.1 RidA family protein [Shimia sp. R10_1]